MPMEKKKYIPTIGLEIHAELKTKTKMFCDSPHDPEEKHPNTNVCPICMGHPGTLPTINKEAVRQVLRVGAALGGTLATRTYFERKNYFYPDLPKGYQISQRAEPLVSGGALTLLSSAKRVRIHHVHLEEDAGKLIHDEIHNTTLIDFNRAGVPLLELVTEPDMNSAAEAEEFAKELQLLFRYLGASDADMEKGQMRVEVNISLAPESSAEKGTKVEVKNINSFRAASRAVAYEIERQSALLKNGERVAQETRGWDEAHQQTVSQRSKEEAHDYRYFPEPDLPLLRLDESPEFLETEIRVSLPELPQQKRQRLQREYGFTDEQALFFVYERSLADYVEKTISELLEWVKSSNELVDQTAQSRLITLAANYALSDVQGILKEKMLAADELLMTPENFAELLKMLYQNTITSRVAKDVLRRMVESGGDPCEIIAAEGLGQVSDSAALQEIVRKVIAENPNPVGDYKKGKETALQNLVGQVMRQTRGSADPGVVRESLIRLLS